MRRMLFLWVAVLALSGAFATTACAAGKAVRPDKNQARYKLEAGKGYTVCERYVRMMNAFPPDEPPMICEQKFRPDFPDFAMPKWENMDVKENLDLIMRLETWLYGRGKIVVNNDDPIWRRRKDKPEWAEKPTQKEWLAEIGRRIGTGESRPRLRRIELVLADGKPEHLLAYIRDTGQCQRDLAQYGGTHQSANYLFLYDASGEVDLGGRPSFNADGNWNLGGTPGQDKLNGLAGREQILLHKDRPYFLTTYPYRNDISYHLRPATPYPDHPDTAYIFQDRCIVRYNFQPSKAK